MKRFWYRKAKGSYNGAPFVFEVGVAETEEPGALFHAINFSPSFEDPLAGTSLVGPEFQASGIRGFLNSGHALPDAESPEERMYHTAAVVHLVTPAPAFLDRGKTRLKMEDGPATEGISRALWLATKALYQEEERRRRDAARQQRADRARLRAVRENEPSQIEVVFWVMEEAVAKATGNGRLPTRVRNLIYAVRAMIQDYTASELKYDYFSQTLVPRWQEENGPIHSLYYDPRGVLHEPHSGNTVPLGTREVEDYRFPD